MNLLKLFFPILPILSITLAVFLLALPFFKEGMPFGHDIFAHLTYAKLFIQALSEGQFPVRWTNGVKSTASQPLFNFYQVGFYYLVSLINKFFPSFILSLKFSIIFLWWTGTLFTFLFNKRFGLFAAIFGALIYAFSPYLILDIYIRASFPEFMAISLFPGILWSLEKIFQKAQPIFIAILAVLFGAALFSHLPSVVIFTPILLGYLLFLIISEGVKLRSLIFTTLGIILGLGISSFYLLPAIFELSFIQIYLLKSDGFDFHQHFLAFKNIFSLIWGYEGSWWGQKESLSFILGIPQWLIWLTALFTLAIFKKLDKNLLFWLEFLAYPFFFSSSLSLFIWQRLEFLSYIQFPWRFFMVIPLISSVLAACLLSLLRVKYQVVIIFVAFFLNLFIFQTYLKPEKYILADYFNLSYEEWKDYEKTLEFAYFEQGYSLIEFDYKFTETPIKSLSNKITAFSLFATFILIPIYVVYPNIKNSIRSLTNLYHCLKHN